MDNNKLTFTEDQLIAYSKVYGLHDGSVGGYVIGNSHDEGGIKVVRETGTKGIYELILEMEGDEYIMNAMATIKYKDRLDKINAFKKTVPSIEYNQLNDLSNVIAVKNMGMIVVSKWDQYIINKYATAKYIEELDRMNKEALDEYLKLQNIE